MVSDSFTQAQASRQCVLILVLMEYGLWLADSATDNQYWTVLILVLMEYGLWLSPPRWPYKLSTSLNPCSNGIWSLTGLRFVITLHRRVVLILVLMEYGLWPVRAALSGVRDCVLILVLMEYGLWHGSTMDQHGSTCLNPCSNGIWSLTVRVQ